MATYILTLRALLPYSGQEHNDPKVGLCHTTMALICQPEEAVGWSLHFSFCLISPHTHTLWWLLQQADIMAGGRLGDIILLCCKQGRIYGLPVLCVGG